MADQLATVAQVKARLQGTGGAGVTWTAADDTLLGELIDQVSDFIQGPEGAGRKLVPEAAQTYTFDTMAGNVLRIPRGIRAITTLQVATSNQPDSGGTYITVPAADRLLRPLAVDRPIGWPATEVWISPASSGSIVRFGDAMNGAVILGDFGFAAVPPAIASVTIDAVVTAWMTRKLGASGVVGADDTAVAPWVRYFSKGSPQLRTILAYKYQPIA